MSALVIAAVQVQGNDLGPILKILILALLIAGPGLAKLLKRIAEASRSKPDSLGGSPLDPPTRDVTWRDLLEGRAPERAPAPRPVPQRSAPPARDVAQKPVLAEMPDEDELEASGEDAGSLEEQGAAPPLEVLEGSAKASSGAVSSAAAEVSKVALPRQERAGKCLFGRRVAMSDWRRAIVAREVLGRPVAWREGRELPFS
jgi:hypothetical protein